MPPRRAHVAGTNVPSGPTSAGRAMARPASRPVVALHGGHRGASRQAPSAPVPDAVLNPHDRRDLAFLGLMVLVYGLVVAPALHAVVGHAGTDRQHRHVYGAATHRHGFEAAAHPHAHGHDEATAQHAHGHDEPGAPEEQPGHGPDGHQHLTGSVEHLSGVVSAWVQVEPPRVRWVSWLAERLAGPTRAPGVAPRPTAMPQGP